MDRSHQLTKKIILVVDDAKENVDLLDKLLRNENYNVIKSYSAKQARESLLSEHVDLILLDVNMPEQDGYSFCKEIREIEKFKLLPILFITSVDREVGFQEAISNGGDDFISKPFHKKELIAKIQAFLRIKILQDELLFEKARYEKELRAARKVQEQMVPEKYVSWNGMQAYSYLKPMFQIGGDFVDIWEENDRLHLVIADCSGHGPSAALVAVMFKMQLLNCPKTNHLARKVEYLRKNLKGILPEDYFITFVYIILDSNGEMEYIKCGHPEPLIYDGSEVSTLPGLSPIIVDLDLHLNDSICQYKMKKGSSLLLYTDGLIEATNSEYEMLETSGLMKIFQKNVNFDSNVMFQNIINGVIEYCGNVEPEDDMAMVCIKF
jgi:sigma-B regulation protein RsbU (phosphoserine phosphatase)